MKIRIARGMLSSMLGMVKMAVDDKGIEAMKFIKVEADAENSCITLTATEMNVIISMSASCEVDEAGVVGVAGSMFAAFTNALPEGVVEIECDCSGGQLHMNSGRCNYRLATWVGEFPCFIGGEGGEAVKFEILGSELEEQMKTVKHAICKVETRRALMGIHFESINGDVLSIMATDGTRLALHERDVNIGKTFGFTLPTAACDILTAILAKHGDDKVAIECTRTNVTFSGDQWRFGSRLIDVEWPQNARKAIPDYFEHEIVVDKSEFIDEITRAAMASCADGKNAVKLIGLKIGNGEISISSNQSEKMSSKTSFPVKYDGDDVSILFDPDKIKNAIAAMIDDDIRFMFNMSHDPIAVRCSQSQVCVVMPLRV